MIRVLIVDDEAPARAKLRKLLAGEERVEVVGEAADGDQAVESIRRLAPDLVFLDIQMPRRDGFGVIEQVGVEAMPLTVFVTAFDQHALKAFEVHALDYLLKPFAASRLRRLVARVRERLTPSSTAGPSATELARQLEERLEALLATIGRPAAGSGVAESAAGEPPLKRLLVKKGPEREALLAVDEIDLVRSEGNYLRFFSRGEESTRRGTLKELEERLEPEQFLRINRSEIVRLDAVAELQPWFHGDYRVILQDGTMLTWSRRYRKRSDL